MAKFNYVAMDSTGKETKGVLEMGSQTEALNRLKDMGLLPTKVTEAIRTGTSKILRKRVSEALIGHRRCPNGVATASHALC